jgi:anti-sigma-K factor RskA
MDEELQKLIDQLRNKKCPPEVLERVAQRISRERTPGRSWGSSLGWAIAITCLIAAAALWPGRARRHERPLAAELAEAQARANRALVVQQTQEAFGVIGEALIRAAAHTENTLLKEAAPPLRNGFETVKNKISNPI